MEIDYTGYYTGDKSFYVEFKDKITIQGKYEVQTTIKPYLHIFVNAYFEEQKLDELQTYYMLAKEAIEERLYNEIQDLIKEKF